MIGYLYERVYSAMFIPWVPETFHARFRSSLISDPREKFSRGFAARFFGLRPTRHPPKAPRRTREKTSGTQGTMFSVHMEIAVLASPVNPSVNLRTVNNMGFHILHHITP